MSQPISHLKLERSEIFMARIREACSLLGIRQKDLAESLQLKPSQMNLYFQGKVEMRTDRLLPLLEILGIDLERQLEERIRELGDTTTSLQNSENKVLAKIGRLDEYKRQSLLRIIHILGSK
ncbi:helix-turn-helix transcriptional regulator [Bdellovibrio sp. 22V]|uniref:helix-turn-helix domain-containing protein n=1 Tax=Bdellovibrio TaxID=958 RepID=UPI002543997D|nr:helix-turn-helix transcriptional regulator [Bdellovibrio sp. 22V]WII72465.1 helix-turn-helix transcriptional regulator [Bdellovibrio sp. 22V]